MSGAFHGNSRPPFPADAGGALKDPGATVWDTELIGGLERRASTVVDYLPEWPARFTRERRSTRAALGATAGRVDHIGSTSVPGLAAKPIVGLGLGSGLLLLLRSSTWFV